MMIRKIMLVCPSFSGGGAEKVTCNLANYFSSLSYEVIIVVFRAVGPYREFVSGGVEIVDLDSRGRFAFFKLLRVFLVKKPDIVLSMIRECNILVGLAALSLRGRIIFREANTLDSLAGVGVLSRKLYLLGMRFSYRFASRIIANSAGTRDSLLEYSIADIKKISVIGNPVLSSEVVSLANAEIGHRWFRDRRLKVVLSVGRLHRQKNHALLIRAFAKVHEDAAFARLVILGEGEEKAGLEKLVLSLGMEDYVQIIPFVNNPFPYYRGASVFALSSDWEGFGNVLVEAMACGTPVVARNCPGGVSMILCGGRFGELVPLNDSDALRKAILRELLSPKAESFLLQARERAMGFSVDAIARKYLRVMAD